MKGVKFYVTWSIETDIAEKLREKQKEEKLPNINEVLRVLIGTGKKKNGK